MKDRFSDTSKQIFDSPDFEEVQNAIGQLEEIIRTRSRQRSHHDGGGNESGGGGGREESPTKNVDSRATTVTAGSGGEDDDTDDKSKVISGSGGPDGEGKNNKGISVNKNNNIILSSPVETKKSLSSSKSNGIHGNGTAKVQHEKNGKLLTQNAISSPNSDKVATLSIKSDGISKNERNSNKGVVIIAQSNGGSHMKSKLYQKKSASSNSVISTTTAMLHSPTPAFDNDNSDDNSGDNLRNSVNKTNNDDGRARVIKSNGILKKISSSSSTSSSNLKSTRHASQAKGTATVSTETTRSGSKTPEITITPGSEVLGGDLVETELPESRLLLSSARVLGGERASPEDLPDSGCTGLLDEDEDSCSLQRGGSSCAGTSAGDQHQNFAVAAGSSGGGGVSGGGDRDSGGGSVGSSSGIGGYNPSSKRSPGNNSVDKEVIYAQIQKKKQQALSGSGGVGSERSELPVYQQLLQNQPLLHVEGPVDGSPYAVINPLVKHKALVESGIPADQMKDLDRLLNALVQEAESIDIPYHARTDSLPFSYTAPPGPPPSSAPAHLTGSKRSPYGGSGSSTLGGGSNTGRYGHSGGYGTSYQQQQQQSQYGSSVPSSSSGSRYRQQLEHSHSTPVGTRLSSSVSSSQSYQQQQQVPQYYHQSALEEQILNPEPTSNYSRAVSRHQSISGSTSGGGGGGGRVGARTMEQQGYRVRPSLSSTSFSAGYGNGTGITRRLRSQSADGRRDTERDEDADEWLARQMKKLQEKRASKNAPRSDWLAELKRALPAATAGGSTGAGATPSAIAAAASAGTNTSSSSVIERSSYEHQSSRTAGATASTSSTVPPVTGTQNLSEFRPYPPSKNREDVVTSSSGAVMFSSGTLTGGNPGAGRRSHISYSSEDDDDVELEMYQRGRRVQRHYSESAYDRALSASSTRAPSQLSNVIETPFPICPPTPYFNSRPVSPGKPPRSPKGIRRQISSSTVPVLQEIPGRMERAQTPVNPRPIYMVDSEVKFAQDLSEYWYKPFASREETVSALVNQKSGAFLIRNSNSFPGAFGLAVKVSETAGDKGIRHFLIEPTRFGVRLRGSPLEPVFSSLSALVYAHSIDPLALPTTLSLPSFDILPKSSQSTTALLLRQGAACNNLFLGLTSVECLTGDEAIHRGISQISGKSPIPISLRLSKHGLTLTDVFRKQFFRLHFALSDISYASLVPGRSVAYGNEVKQVFAIVARAPRATENSVIVLAELEQGQPANAIVSFILRVIAWQH